MNRAIRFAALALGLMVLAPVQVAAQQERRVPRQQMEQQLRERFEAVIVERVGLDEAQAAAVREITGEIMELRRELARREMALQRQLRGLTPANLDAERASDLIEEIMAVRAEEVRVMQLETERLREHLSDVQVLVLFQVREEMGRRIREMRGARPGGPGGPPGGGRGGGTGGTPGGFEPFFG